MEDREIVKLFWERSPQAVDALAEAYGPDLRALARRLLEDPLDVEECVNDAYLALWQGIPPAKPAPLLPYALRVVRNLCLKRRRWNRAGTPSWNFSASLTACFIASGTFNRSTRLTSICTPLRPVKSGTSPKDREPPRST